MRERLLAGFYSPSIKAKALAVCMIFLLQLVVTWLVYTSGGVKFPTLHVMYVPVVFAGFMFGGRYGVVAGLVAGLLLGPYMPLDSMTGEPQLLKNWLYRTFFFCLLGGIVGAGASALRKQMAMLVWLNDHDARSGMLGRSGLLKSLRRIIAASEPGKEISVIVINLSNFLEIQNTFGLDFGERLLIGISERWKALVPDRVPIAMVQPDRIAAVFPDTVEAQYLRAEIEARMREPYEIDGVPVYVEFNIGAARFPSHGSTAEEVLQKAGVAMHTAVIHKQSFALYDNAIDHTSRDNLILLGLVPAAINNNEFVIWHQSKFSLATGKISGTEALLRWRHPQRGLVPPGAFIPQAEETALINSLTECVIRASLADQAAWTARGKDMNLAINMSVQSLHDSTLVELLHETTLLHGIDPQRVEIEITESAVMGDFDSCVHLISSLRERGYRVAIDDFGTGYSSLAYLQKLPVTTLKIDQAFIKHLASSDNDQKIVRTILSLAKSFGLSTVAEGVEDEAALALLREWGCDYAQGFALHRPAPYADFLEWLEEERRTSELI